MNAPLPRRSLGAALAAIAVGACATAPAAPTPSPTDVPATPAVAAVAPSPRAARPSAAPFIDRAVDHALAGDEFGALEDAREGLARDPQGFAAGVTMVEALLGYGRWSEARGLARRVADHHPGEPGAHYALGRALLAMGRDGEALGAFEAALFIDANDVPSLVGAMTVHAARPEGADAAHELGARLAAIVGPNDPYLLAALGVLAETEARWAEAEALYRRALEQHETPMPSTRYNLARLIEAQRGAAAARPDYEAFLGEAGRAHRRRIEQVQAKLQEKP